MDKINAQIAFVLELEKLKAVLRKTRPVGLDRFENTAEHSWQTAMTAMVFLQDTDLDQLCVLKMLLIHDIVEIDAGDVFVYDAQARADIADEELKAAERIFGLLQEPLGSELLSLWKEFESRSTPEAQFAKAIDRVNPVLQNLTSDKNSWLEHGITREQVIAMNEEIQNASPELWAVIETRLEAYDFS